MMTVDQMIAGASNVLIAVLAARLLTAARFGLFGIVFLLYMILIGVTRALVSDPLLVHPVESRERPGEAIGTALLLAAPLTAVLATVALGIRLSDPALGDALFVLAACLPLLVLQDVGRYLGFATRRPMRAVALDAVWLVIMFACVAVLVTRHGRTLASFVAAWGGSGAAAGAIVFMWHDVRGVRFGLAWLKETWGLAWRYLVSYTSMQGAALGMSSEVGAIAGARALGGVQGTLLLVRPFTTFQIAAVGASTSEVAHSTGDRGRIRRHVLLSSGLCGGIAALNALVIVVLPSRIGKLVLGDSWHVTHPLLAAAAVYVVCVGVQSGPQAALYGLRAMKEAMTINVATMVMLLAGALAGALLGGAKGAMWLVAAAEAILAVVWWITFAGRIRRLAPAAVARPGSSAAALGAAMRVEPSA